MRTMHKNSERGFTLMELLIVVAIIAVLVAIAIPVFGSSLEKSKEATDLANIRSAYAEVTVGAVTEDVDAPSKTVILEQSKAGWVMEDAAETLNNLTKGHVIGAPADGGGKAVVEWLPGEQCVQITFDGEGGGGSGDDESTIEEITASDSGKEIARKFAKIANIITFEKIRDAAGGWKGEKTYGDVTYWAFSKDDGQQILSFESALKEAGYDDSVDVLKNSKNSEVVYFDDSGNFIGYGYRDRDVKPGNDYYTIISKDGEQLYQSTRSGYSPNAYGNEEEIYNIFHEKGLL